MRIRGGWIAIWAVGLIAAGGGELGAQTAALRDHPAATSIRAPALLLQQRQAELGERLAADSTTGLTVIFGAIGFSMLAGGLATVTGLNEDRPKVAAAIGGLGVAGGAVLGAKMGRRQPAVYATLLGAGFGAVPLVVLAEKQEQPDIGYAMGMFGLYTLSVFGAWLGNTFGQEAALRP